jgi:hypothetical protein
MIIKTTITKILSKEKVSFKSSPAYFTGNGLKFGKEQTKHRLKVIFQCSNGRTYFWEFSDGRKANTFYEGKEIWGNEGYGAKKENIVPIRFEHWWWTKEEFEKTVNLSISRAEERIKSDTEEIARLKTLL